MGGIRLTSRPGIAIVVLATAALGGALWYVRSLDDDQREKAAEAGKPVRAIPVETKPAKKLWPVVDAGVAARAPGEVLAPSGEPVARVLARMDDPDASVRRAMWLQLNNLGPDALPLVEKVAAQAGSLSPEAALKLDRAAGVIRKRAKWEKIERERLAWEAAQVRRAYEGSWGTNAKWDADVVRAIDGWIAVYLDPGGSARPVRGKAPPPAPEDVLAAFKAAQAKGCDDPLVLALHYLAVGEAYRTGSGPVTKRFPQVVKELQSDEYPAFVRLMVAARFVALQGGRGEPQLQRTFPKLLQEMAADRAIPAWALNATAEAVFDLTAERDLDPFDTVIKFAEAYEAAAPGNPGPLVLRGRQAIRKAWQARGSGWASTVTPEGWKGFHAKLAEAEAALTKAYELDPSDPRAATHMITVKLGQGDQGGGREAMERWFERAMDANPDNVNACWSKLYYLRPRWHGSHEDMLAFGRECLATENWRGGVALLLAQAHEEIAEETGDAKEYYEQPAVWDDLRALYAGGLANFPHDHRRRARYALIACRSGKWDVAAAQFKALGDRPMYDAFGGKAMQEYYARKAARLAGGAGAPGRRI